MHTSKAARDVCRQRDNWLAYVADVAMKVSAVSESGVGRCNFGIFRARDPFPATRRPMVSYHRCPSHLATDFAQSTCTCIASQLGIRTYIVVRSMYAETANKLVLDAKRIQNLQHLPPYAATTVRAVTKEVRDLDREVNSLLAPYQSQSTQGSDGTQIKSSGFNPAEDPATACALLVNHLAMRRNKRCLLAYHRTRTDKLEEMCWSGADVAEIQSAATSTRAQSGDSSNLSADEEAYINSYSNLLAAYKGQWTDIDLTGSLEPPRDIFIDVRVLRDAGEIQTEYGSITLTKNSQFYVRQADVERLIQQGYLQKLG